jgi:hypothetical protein
MSAGEPETIPRMESTFFPGPRRCSGGCTVFLRMPKITGRRFAPPLLKVVRWTLARQLLRPSGDGIRGSSRYRDPLLQHRELVASHGANTERPSLLRVASATPGRFDHCEKRKARGPAGNADGSAKMSNRDTLSLIGSREGSHEQSAWSASVRLKFETRRRIPW